MAWRCASLLVAALVPGACALKASDAPADAMIEKFEALEKMGGAKIIEIYKSMSHQKHHALKHMEHYVKTFANGTTVFDGWPGTDTGYQVSWEGHAFGTKAKDLPAWTTYTGCHDTFGAKTKAGTEGSRDRVCNFKVPAGEKCPPLGRAASYGMDFTFEPGDRLVYEGSYKMENVPEVMKAMFPPTFPPSHVECPVCGGKCDMTTKTSNPEMWKWMSKMIPIWKQSAQAMGQKYEFNENAHMFDMPKCPLKISKDDQMPGVIEAKQAWGQSDGSSTGQSHAVEIDLKDDDTLKPSNFAGIVTDWWSHWTWKRADGTIILDLDQRVRVGQKL